MLRGTSKQQEEQQNDKLLQQCLNKLLLVRSSITKG